jgi:hypothetical protein
LNPFKYLRRLASPRDEGLSLTEMMVSIVMLSLIMVALTSTVIITQRFSARNGSYLADADQNRNAIEGVSKTLRTAVLPKQLLDYSAGDAAFIQGTDTSVQFYADLDIPTAMGPSKVSYLVQQAPDGTGDLIETVQPPDAGALNHNYTWNVAANARTRTLARGLIWPTPVIFTYYDNTGIALPTSGGLSAQSMQNVRTIDVVLTVKTLSGIKRLPTTYVQRVGLPNVDVLPSSSPTP